MTKYENNTTAHTHIDDVPCITVELPDDQGGTRLVVLHAKDWESARALTPEWRVAVEFEKPHVISTALAAIVHPKRSYKRMNLRLADFIVTPTYGFTVRFLDGCTTNLVRSNLLVLPKGARLNTKPRDNHPNTLIECTREAQLLAEEDGRDVDQAVDAAIAAFEKWRKARTAATRAAKKAFVHQKGAEV